jgi:DNA-binding transcriptional MerR regulator
VRIYEVEGLICPSRTPANIRLYSRTTSGGSWIRHLTQNVGVNLAGVRILFELEGD